VIWLRSAFRVLAVASVTGAMWSAMIVALPFFGRGGGRAGRFQSRMCRRWARLVAPILGARVEVQGTPPQGAFLLVANHLSYVDVIVLASRLEGVFIAKDELLGWPIIGRICRSVGTIFVSRERRTDVSRVSARIADVLKEARGVVLFPEGTSTEGATVLPFKSSLLEPAVRGEVPVCYASITYRTPPGALPARLSVCWWGEMGFLDHVRDLLALPGFTARIVFGGERIFEPDRKVLAERLWEAVHRQFEPVTS